MPKTPFSDDLRAGASPRSKRSTGESVPGLRRRLAQTRAALEASRRDNEALHRMVDRLLTESRGRSGLPDSRYGDGARRRPGRDAMADPSSRNP